MQAKPVPNHHNHYCGMVEGVMADDPIKRGSQDRTRVNVHEKHELRYWTAKWGVTADRLREAVAKAGVSVSAVAKQLGINKGEGKRPRGP
jgi:hypothetical protein